MHRFITLSALLIMIGTACVPARKYEELEEKYKKSIEDAELYKTKAQDCDAEKLELESQLTELSKKHGILTEDLSNLDRSYKETLRQYEEIKENH